MHEEECIVLNEEMLALAVGDRWSTAEVSTVAALLADGGGKFPPGTRTVPGELVKAVQRERLVASMLRAVSRIGYRDVNVQDVLDRAGVSRPTFYEHFKNKEDCFLAAFDTAVERFEERLRAGTDEVEGWRDRLAAGLEEVLRFVCSEPDCARTLIVEARASCPEGLRRRERLLARLAVSIETGIEASGDQPPSIAAAGIVGGIESVLYGRLNNDETDDLSKLLPSLLYFAVLPWVGRTAAIEELQRPGAGAAAPVSAA